MKFLLRPGLPAQPLRHALLSSSKHAHQPWPAVVSRRYSASPRLSATQFVNRKRIASDTITDRNAPKPQRFSRPTNEEIRAPYIQIVNAEGQLEPPIPKLHVLRTLQKSGQILVELDRNGPNGHTICKLMSFREFRDQEKAKDKAARQVKHAAKTSVKQIELNWSIDPHDLSHRLKKLPAYVDKGRTVEIILTRKKGKRIATESEIKQLLDQINAAIEGANARQSNDAEGEAGKTLTITVEKRV